MVCTVSVWNSAPYFLHREDIDARSDKVPISLLACIKDTREGGPCCKSSSRWSRSMCPLGYCRTKTVLVPKSRSMAESVCKTQWCSVRALTKRRIPKSNTERFSAILLASVPPEVKKISPIEAFSACAICLRACSTAARALRPSSWIEDGLPDSSRSARSIVSTTAGSGGVVAAWSK